MIKFQYQYPGFKIKSALKVKSWLIQVSRGEKKKIGSLVYVFVNDEELLAINRNSLKHDYYTDIITFPYAYIPIESEVYISVDRVADHALKYKVSIEQEMARVLVHGLLHMCGYSDKPKIKKIQMTEREDYWLKKLKT
jgi:probable rRNA maturation factor